MLPDAEVVLLEPMERRTDWLSEVAETLRLDNVVVRRGRAQDVHGDLVGDAVTVRAVASLDKLYRWALPLLRAGGTLVALKGGKAEDEVEAARHVGRKLGAGKAVRAGRTDDRGSRRDEGGPSRTGGSAWCSVGRSVVQDEVDAPEAQAAEAAEPSTRSARAGSSAGDPPR